MKLVWVLLLGWGLFGSGAQAATLVCNARSHGWQVQNLENGEFYGNGYFHDWNTCERVRKTSQDGFVCGAENGGLAVFDVRTCRKVGRGHYRFTNDCLQAIRGARGGYVCGAQGYGYGTKIVSRSNGLKGFGNGIFTHLSTCQFALNHIQKGLVCAAHNGGAQVFRLKGAKRLGNGHFIQLQGCLGALQSSIGGAVCGANRGGGSIFNTRTGRQIGKGHFSNINTCFQATRSVRGGQVCAPERGRVIRARVDQAKTYGPYYPHLQACLSAI